MRTKGASTKREQHRAELLHRCFSQVIREQSTYEEKFRRVRQLLGSSGFLRAYKTFENLFLKWKKAPCPETLLRRWTCGNPSQNEWTAGVICEFAAQHKLSVYTVFKRLDLSISYATVLRLYPERCREVSRLARIERARRKLAKARAKSLKIIGGLEL